MTGTVIAGSVFCVYLAACFYQLSTTVSDYSWGDIANYNQLAYNFTHGYPFQSSIYRLSLTGTVANPYPYAHSHALHVNFTPYLIVWASRLFPPVYGLYTLAILFNLASFLFLGRRIYNLLTTDSPRLPYLFVFALFACMLPFAETITYKGHLPLFAGPFILAVYYFGLRRQFAAMITAALLVCGISEDMSMFMCVFSAYLFVFEKEMRKPALAAGILSALYTAAAVLVIQPAAASGLVVEKTSSNPACLSSKIAYGRAGLHGQLSMLSEYLRGLKSGAIPVYLRDPLFFSAGLCGILTALLLANADWRSLRKTKWEKALALALLAPASHWLISIFYGSGHHFIPLLACAFIALLIMASGIRSAQTARWRLAAIMCMMTFSLLSARTYRLIYKFNNLRPADAAAETSNKSLLAQTRATPEDASLCYWTNMGVDGFLSGRRSVWRFPEYFDSADYLLVQKDASMTFYKPDNPLLPWQVLESDGCDRPNTYSTGSRMPIDPEAVRSLTNALVAKRALYTVKIENEHLLLLQRKEKADLPNPPATYGLGWIRNIGQPPLIKD